ncbi:hypothetical protein [Ectopseudomonas toyotomiensis]|uniref:Lipoprotein n=1 Tax=Ectopseudomonas toyotomiensis TaxID=554344 RepID=A0AA42IJG6_9GAMM|nr:hypothetical protein [Pseudomonas toyotomiensis]MBG0838615.1 hypothetical protein [Pseudomonas toyotomiensis]MDH0700310.1 hypothetical protein [Pseudomonas toyotomiensis]
MHKKSGIALILAGLLAGCANQPGGLQGETLDLGDSQRVSSLFAYPNNCSVICYRDWTLEQTVEHYLQQSLTRDGYPQASVRVTRNGERVYAHFDGTPADYGKPLLQLLDAGELAYQGASQLNRDGKWQYNWYFFLPLGMALDNRKSVELLHFPPDYSLTQAQDYLRSSTTDRWAALLSYNGIAPEQTPAYQTIIDIAPIAAPASAGSALEGVYGYFTSYQRRMVSELSVGSGDTSLPMVAFGAPVRSWITQQYGVNLPVLGLGQIDAAPGQQVSVLGANHPSYIWYAADPANNKGSEAVANAAGIKVMGQDLSAACWQAGMGQQPTADPQQTLNTCTEKWQVTEKLQTCELFFTSVRNLKPEEAAAKCKAG